MLLLLVPLECIAEPEFQPPILHPKGLLWKIEKNGGAASYLYGTMHVSDPRVVNLAPIVESAFEGADHFVMEVILNFQAIGYIAGKSYFSDGNSLDKIMKPEDFQRLTRILHEHWGVSAAMIKGMKPWAVLMMLMAPAEQQSQASAALDMVLFRRASQREIKISGLESAEEQIAVFDSMSMQDQLWLLNRALADFSKSEDNLSIMLEAYISRDLARLVEIQQQAMYEDSPIDDRLMEQLINVRNKRMVQRMGAILKQGNSFIAIGALHLPGKAGVLSLLEQQGFTVTSLY